MRCLIKLAFCAVLSSVAVTAQQPIGPNDTTLAASTPHRARWRQANHSHARNDRERHHRFLWR